MSERWYWVSLDWGYSNIFRNSPKNSYNRSKLDSLSEVDIEIYATDEVPQGTPATLIENLHTKNQGRTGGLKKGAEAWPTKYKDVYVAFEGKN